MEEDFLTKTEIEELAIEAINQLDKEQFDNFKDSMQILMELYKQFNKYNKRIQSLTQIKEKIKKIIKANEQNTINSIIDEIKAYKEIPKDITANEALEETRAIIHDQIKNDDIKESFNKFYAKYQKVLQEVQGFLNRTISIVYVFDDGFIDKAPDITYTMKLQSGTRGLGASVIAQKKINQTHFNSNTTLFKMYNVIKQDSKDFPAKGSGFYTYYDYINKFKRTSHKWYKVQSLGSLNEAYAAFYFNKIDPKDKEDFITNAKYGIIAVDNAPGLLQEDIMLKTKDGKVIGLGIKSKGASGAGFVQGMEMLIDLNEAISFEDWKNKLLKYSKLQNGTKINKQVMSTNTIKTLNSKLNKKLELEKIFSNINSKT